MKENIATERPLEIKLDHKVKYGLHNQYKGRICEYVARKYFEGIGYRVCKTIVSTSLIPTDLQFNEDFLETLKTTRFEKLDNLLKRRIKKGDICGMPDLFCSRLAEGGGEEYIFVECKAHYKHVSDVQEKVFSILNHASIPVFTFRMNIDIPNFTYSKPTIHEVIATKQKTLVKRRRKSKVKHKQIGSIEEPTTFTYQKSLTDL